MTTARSARTRHAGSQISTCTSPDVIRATQLATRRASTSATCASRRTVISTHSTATWMPPYGKLNFLHLQQLGQQHPPQSPLAADELTAEPHQLPVTPRKTETTPSVATPLSVVKGDAPSTPSKSAKSYACSKCRNRYQTRELCRMHIIVAHAPSPSLVS